MTVAQRPRVAWRVPLLVFGVLSMLFGAWLGLIRAGWALPLPQEDQLVIHGPLMVCGFLGTLISLERAVGLGVRWAYAGPLFTAAGAILIALAPLAPAGPVFVSAGSLVVVAIFIVVARRQPALFVWTMLAGAAVWFGGNVQWALGAPVFRVVFWWMAFLVLTIAGERLELNRLLRPTRAVQMTFAAAAALVLAGVGTHTFNPVLGVRVAGAGLFALALWLARNDIARRTVRQHGLTRFMAVCLLAGYAWLGAGAAIAVVTGTAMPGVIFDATLHSVFLGFVISMVFAHAPVIFPAVLGRPLAYSPTFYVHVIVLHASVLVRVVADLVEPLQRFRAWGAMFNAIALGVFLANTIRSILIARTSA